MRVLAIFGVALMAAGWIWQTYNMLRGDGWKNVKAALAGDPAFATVCFGALLVFIAVMFL